MAIIKPTTILKHLMIDPAHPLPPNSVTYPGTGGSFAVHNNVGGVPISNGTIPPPNLKEHTIQGSMLTVQKVISEHETLRMGFSVAEDPWNREIKKQLVQQIVEKMFESNCIEFTRQKDAQNGNLIFRARVFVTPDSTVRIIREMQK